MTIPKRIRDRFGITIRTELEFQEENGQIILAKRGAARDVAKLKGRIKRLPFGRDVDEYIDAIRGGSR